MKVCIVESDVGRNGTSVNVHERNCRVIIRALERRNAFCTFYHSDSIVDENAQFDIILISYASFYMDFKKFVRLMENQKSAKIGWITNEYNLEPNSCFKKFITFIISNFEQHGKWENYRYLMVNLNALLVEEKRRAVFKKYDVIYYGTYRPGREKYFKKYLRKEIILSTSSKNMKKYKSLGCDCGFIDKLVWRKQAETLNLFRASLYIEDEKTHTLYNHLANRFYEGIICNTAPLFDESCLNTIKKSGYDIPDFYIVDSYETLMERVKQIPNEENRKDMIKFHERAIFERDEALQRIYQFLTEILNESGK
jgi:hypothetical protein